MIRIRCQRRRGGHRLEIVGHAQHGPAGQDIVCAGVSAISWALLGYLDGRGLLEDAWADKGAMGLDIRGDDRARAALELARRLEGKEPINFPRETAMGAMALYISDQSVVNFQPMNVNFGLIPPLGYRVKGKRNKNAELSKRALEALGELELS